MARNTISVAFVLHSVAATSLSVTVKTTSGPLRGNQYGKHQEFLGIPYAEQPVGPLRFQPTGAVRPWNTTLDATSFGPGCPQRCILPPNTCPAKQSEACLQLNIFVPAHTGPLPVLFFIPGGRYEQGSAGTGLYNATALAVSQNIVVVTTNYRLGALAALTTSSGSASGNLAIRDQTLALKWVAANIKAFGGDPAAITITGQSAGGTSTSILAAVPAVASDF
eukprot:gene11873-2163_t